MCYKQYIHVLLTFVLMLIMNAIVATATHVRYSDPNDFMEVFLLGLQIYMYVHIQPIHYIIMYVLCKLNSVKLIKHLSL